MRGKKLIEITAVGGLLLLSGGVLAGCTDNEATTTQTNTQNLSINHPKTLLNGAKNNITTKQQADKVAERYFSKTLNESITDGLKSAQNNSDNNSSAISSNNSKATQSDKGLAVDTVSLTYLLVLQTGKYNNNVDFYQKLNKIFTQPTTQDGQTQAATFTQSTFDYAINNLPMDVKQAAQYYANHKAQMQKDYAKQQAQSQVNTQNDAKAWSDIFKK